MPPPFPDRQAVAELLAKLLNKPIPVRELEAGKGGAIIGNEGAPLVAGFYTIDGETAPAAAIILNFPLAVGLSGALLLMPTAVILEDLEKGELHEVLLENVHEIMNIIASLLNKLGAPHLRLTQAVPLGGASTGALMKLLARKPLRLDLEITVPPCPTGRLFIIRAP